MAKSIECAIKDWFPEDLWAPDDFENWCSRIREDVQAPAADLVQSLDVHLQDLMTQLRQEQHGICRDYWERFGGDGDRVIKSVASIRSKLARDILASQQLPSERLTSDELRHRVYAFGDLGRLRIVAGYLSDVDFLQASLLVDQQFIQHYSCPNGVKDFVYDSRRRDGLRGHRARQFSVQVAQDDLKFGFEIQIMTPLQHAWDRRNHALYEWQREAPDWKDSPKAMEVAVDDFSCAETLHLVDRQANLTWTRFLEMRKTENPT